MLHFSTCFLLLLAVFTGGKEQIHILIRAKAPQEVCVHVHTFWLIEELQTIHSEGVCLWQVFTCNKLVHWQSIGSLIYGQEKEPSHPSIPCDALQEIVNPVLLHSREVLAESLEDFNQNLSRFFLRQVSANGQRVTGMCELSLQFLNFMSENVLHLYFQDGFIPPHNLGLRSAKFEVGLEKENYMCIK